ncbi:hypothetical protein yc1106_09851 [Curvularia clavata]|uniref:thioredoxin-dependent peroxiredoxin n=1 Tax=Curvularia clavata TaxID=95742 RepID=A0A9Q8ZIH2_CURCL|nr:hypothetical protein yc1106_09851 [Curvularia clavata]
MAYSAYQPKARVQKPAPQFTGTAVVDGTFEELSLTAYTSTKQWLVLGFVPMAWTFVCPTEILAFSDRAADFAARGASVVFSSTDSEYSLLAWTNASKKDGGLGKINIPLLSDKNHSIAKDYGVLIEEEGIALRGLFLIDPNGIVRQITINDLPVGRSVDETLRLIDAFQFTDKYGEVCPANWNPGDETIKATPEGNKEYLAKVHADTKMSDVAAKTNDLSSQSSMLYATNASDLTPSSSQRLPHQADSTSVRPKALILTNSSSPDNNQTNDVRREAHDKIHPARAMPSAPIAQVLNSEANLLSSQSASNSFAPSSTTPFSGRLVDLLLESPEHAKHRWDQDQQLLQPESTGYSPSVIKLPRLPQPPKKTAKRPRIPPLLQGLHQPPPLPPEGRLFPPITGEKNAFAGERGYDTLFEEPRSKEVDDHAFLDTATQELSRSTQHGKHGSIGQVTAQSVPLGGTIAVHETDVQPNKEISALSQNQPKRGKKRTKWSEQETKDLLIGVSRFGIGNWKKILQCPDFTFNNRTAVDLKDRFRVCCPGEGLKPRQPRSNAKDKRSLDSVHAHHHSHGKNTENADSAINPISTSSESTATIARSTKTAATMPNLSELGIHEPFSKTARRPRRAFTATDDVNLLKGFEKYGPVWHSMRDDPELEFGSRHATDLRDRFRIRYPEKYAKAGYKLKSKEKERERVRRGDDIDKGVEEEEGGGAGPDPVGEILSLNAPTTSKTVNENPNNTTRPTIGTTTLPYQNNSNTNIFPPSTSTAPPPAPLPPSSLSYNNTTNTSTSLKPFLSASYLSDPLPTLPFSDDEDLDDIPSHTHHPHNTTSGGDESPITLSRNILRWADANPSSLYSFAPSGGYRVGGGERSGYGVGGNENGAAGGGASVGMLGAGGGGGQQSQGQSQSQTQSQSDGMRLNMLPEAELWSFSDRTQGLASFKYRG